MRFDVIKRGCLTVVALAGWASQLQAGPVWGYQWEPTTPYIHSAPLVYSSPPVSPISPPVFVPPHGAGQAALLLTSPAAGGSSLWHTTMTAVHVTPLTWAPDNYPGVFNHEKWGLRLVLWDNLLHRWGTVFFTGVFDGTLSRGTSTLTSHFTSSATQTLRFGGPFVYDTFTVTLQPFVPPGPPKKSRPGGFNATVDFGRIVVDPVPLPVQSGTVPHETPEPSTLVLAAVGIGGMGLAARRRR